jgi:hypothetical protein
MIMGSGATGGYSGIVFDSAIEKDGRITLKAEK